jgi:hypothetical protein
MRENIKEKAMKKNEFLNYLYFSPYILLMAIAFGIVFVLLCFRASWQHFSGKNHNYYEDFLASKQKALNILKSIFD